MPFLIRRPALWRPNNDAGHSTSASPPHHRLKVANPLPQHLGLEPITDLFGLVRRLRRHVIQGLHQRSNRLPGVQSSADGNDAARPGDVLRHQFDTIPKGVAGAQEVGGPDLARPGTTYSLHPVPRVIRSGCCWSTRARSSLHNVRDGRPSSLRTTRATSAPSVSATNALCILAAELTSVSATLPQR